MRCIAPACGGVYMPAAGKLLQDSTSQASVGVLSSRAHDRAKWGFTASECRICRQSCHAHQWRLGGCPARAGIGTPCLRLLGRTQGETHLDGGVGVVCPCLAPPHSGVEWQGARQHAVQQHAAGPYIRHSRVALRSACINLQQHHPLRSAFTCPVPGQLCVSLKEQSSKISPGVPRGQSAAGGRQWLQGTAEGARKGRLLPQVQQSQLGSRRPKRPSHRSHPLKLAASGTASASAGGPRQAPGPLRAECSCPRSL